MEQYIKQPISLAEQIATLKQRGLTFNDEDKAVKILENISYFRLAAYWRLMEDNSLIHHFRQGSCFENAYSLYNFDGELKSLLFNAIQRIEIAVRTHMIQQFSMAYGSFWFMDRSLFTSDVIFNKHISSLKDALVRTQEDFIMEHFRKYNQPDMPPVWKTLELATFGTLSRIYSNFSDNAIKKQVARSFGIPQHEFMRSWLENLTIIRNVCAHHARLWNRRFAIRPRLPQRLSMPWISDFTFPEDRLYPQLCCIAYWLHSIDSESTFTTDIKVLLTKYPMANPASMGFPRNWQDEPLWR